MLLVFVVVFIILFYVFIGFEFLVVVVKDMENFKKNVFKVLVMVMFVVLVIYMFILGISIGVLGNGLVGLVIFVVDVVIKMLGFIGGYIIIIGIIVFVGGINIVLFIFILRFVVVLVE